MPIVTNNCKELRIRCDALRGLLHAECGFELDEIAAVESAALAEFKDELKPRESLTALADVLQSYLSRITRNKWIWRRLPILSSRVGS